MDPDWRNMLYPIGFLANVLFAIRFAYQWFNSELKQKSVVDSRFWKISLLGNFIMVCHTMAQLQFGVCVIQGWNGIISWRNLNLMKKPSKQARFWTVILRFFIVSAMIISGFLIQSWIFFDDKFVWARAPTFITDSSRHLPLYWHLLGIIGVILFACRFWVQWWRSEMHQKSQVGRTFWWISLIGGGLSAAYFVMMFDPVNFIGPGLGLIPYVRNLMLIKKHRAQVAES